MVLNPIHCTHFTLDNFSGLYIFSSFNPQTCKLIFLMSHKYQTFLFFVFLHPVTSLTLRRGGAVPSGFCVQDLADLQEGVSAAGGLYLDHRLRLGLHAAQRTDAAGTGPRGPLDAQRFVFSYRKYTLKSIYTPCQHLCFSK